MTNLLNKSNDQPSKFKTRKWVEVSDDSNGTYKTRMQIKFYIFMLMSSLRDYSAVYIFVKGTITITGAGVDAVLVSRQKIRKHHSKIVRHSLVASAK